MNQCWVVPNVKTVNGEKINGLRPLLTLQSIRTGRDMNNDLSEKRQNWPITNNVDTEPNQHGVTASVRPAASWMICHWVTDISDYRRLSTTSSAEFRFYAKLSCKQCSQAIANIQFISLDRLVGTFRVSVCLSGCHMYTWLPLLRLFMDTENSAAKWCRKCQELYSITCMVIKLTDCLYRDQLHESE